jgi:hypothetical protein
MQRLTKLIIQIAQIAFVSVLIATNSASAQVKPDLEPSDPYWGPSSVVSGNAHSYPVDRGQAANYPPIAEVSALFRNVGHKVIKSVTWKYVFYKDEQRIEMLASYKFVSNKTIEPGVSVRLKKSVSATSEPRRTDYQGIIISSIEYADGMIWRADKIKR